jgi:hypothetical protein
MSIAGQTFSRTNFREFAFTTDVIARENQDHVFSNSPTLAIFTGRTLGTQFGANPQSGSGHDGQEGGHAIITRVRLGAHDGAKRGAGPFDTHSTAPDDNTRFAESNWTFYTHALAVAEHDIRINRGDSAIASFLEDQTTSVMLSLADMVATDLHATTGAANALTSIDDLISANDTVQGLSGATYTKYNSRGVSPRGTAPGSVSFASGGFAAQGLPDMRTCYNNASEGMIQPNVVITTYDTHERYEGVLQPQERFQGAVKTADGSFASLAFRSTPVVADPKAASGSMYMLKVGKGGLRLKTLNGADFSFGDWKPSSNQNTMVRPLELTCQMVIENRQYGSNKLTGITD